LYRGWEVLVIRVLITDDDVDVAGGLKLNIEGVEGIEVVGIADSGTAAIRFCDERFVDVVLMDLKMPTMDGLEAARRIKASHPEIRILILTSFALDDQVIQSIKSSCSGYILKGHRAERVVSIVQSVYEGFSVFDPEAHLALESQVTRFAPNKAELKVLNPQEIKMVALVTEGRTDQEIALQLCMDHGHVRNRLSQIREKLGLRNSKELAVWGARMGLWKN